MTTHRSAPGPKKAPTDAEICDAIDGAFHFIDQVLESRSFREQLPERSQVVVSPSRDQVASISARFRQDASPVVIYVPSEQAAYVIDPEQPPGDSERVQAAHPKTA